jgi:diacylglycerol kinase family enzyme
MLSPSQSNPTTPKTGAPTPRLRKISVLINQDAGGVRPGAEHELSRLLAEHGCELRVFNMTGRNLEAVVREAVSVSCDLLVVLAGDGTARLAAELAGPEGPLLAPLAGGTLNMLPHALYGALPWADALQATLNEGAERMVSGGRINGRSFYVAAVLGAPALWGGAREALRSGNLNHLRRRMYFAIRRAFSGGLAYGAEDIAGSASEALVLICPLISKAMQEECALEMVALDLHDAREMLRLAFNGMLGAWRGDPSVSAKATRDGWASMRRAIPSILDGETHRLPRRVEFEFVPRAFRALAPAHLSVPSL